MLNANVFPPLQRIIHHIITTILFPKGGSRNEVTKIHKTIFHCLFNCELMNLPYLMCTLIDKAHFQAKRSLPYAAPLTAIFWFARVDLTPHRQVMIPPSHVYNKLNIYSHMGYQIVTGEFFRYLRDEDDEEDSKSEDNEDTQAILE